LLNRDEDEDATGGNHDQSPRDSVPPRVFARHARGRARRRPLRAAAALCHTQPGRRGLSIGAPISVRLLIRNVAIAVGMGLRQDGGVPRLGTWFGRRAAPDAHEREQNA